MFLKIKIKRTLFLADKHEDKERIANYVLSMIDSMGKAAKTKNDKEYDAYIEERLSWFKNQAASCESQLSFSIMNSLLALVCLSHLEGSKKNADLIINWVYENKK